MEKNNEYVESSYVQDYVMDMLMQMSDVTRRVGLEDLSEVLKQIRRDYLSKD